MTSTATRHTTAVALPPAAGTALREALDGPFHAAKQRWRDEVSADDVVRDPGLTLAEARTWTLDRLRRLSARRLAAAGFPVEVGGEGAYGVSVANFEMLAFGDLSLTIKSGVQHGLFGGAIVNLGTAWHHETFLPDIISSELPGGFAMTELGHGSDVAAIETTITYLPDSDELEVHSPTPSASKAYIGNAAADGRMMAVFGQLIVAGQSQGVHCVLVPIRAQDGTPARGVTIGDQGHKGGLLGVDNGTLTFDHVRVPRRMLLDRYGGIAPDGSYHSEIESASARFFTMLGTLVRGRICVGGAAGSATRKALVIATRYALQRTQFRLPGSDQEVVLLDYPAHQRKLLPEIAAAYAFGFAQNEVALSLDQVMAANRSGDRDERASRELETRAAGLKAAQTAWANEVVQTCREACGGAGYIAANGLTLTRSDVDVFATFEGDNTVLMQLVAKALLLDYRQSWGEMDMRGTAQATAKLVSGWVLERTGARTAVEQVVRTAARRPAREAMLDRDWQLAMFAERERHTVETLAQRMRAASRLPAEKMFAGVSACQEHMLHAARAHTERVVVEAFARGVTSAKDTATAAVLDQLCDLYALTRIEADAAWFLEHHRMSSASAQALRHAIEQRCQDLRPHAESLLDGLGVPEGWLGSAMLS